MGPPRGAATPAAPAGRFPGSQRAERWAAAAVREAPTLLGLAAILAFGLVLRIVYWYGLVTVDPYAYADGAASVARWLPVFDPDILGDLYYTQYLRLSLVVPAGVLFRIFGPGEVQAIAFPLACSLGTSVIAFLMALKVSGDRVAGLIAAFVTAVFPEAVINSTEFLPDNVMAFFASATVLAFWHGLDSHDRPFRARAQLFALTGLLWALAFYARQTAVGLALPLAALVVYRRRFDRAMLFGLPPALAVGAAMSVLLLALGGEPFDDVRTVIGEGRGSQPGALQYTDIDFTYLDTFTGDEKFIPLAALSVLALVLIAATWRSELARRRAVASLLIVIAGLYFYFEHLMRLPSLYSWWKEPRYVLALVPMLAALIGAGCSRWLRLVPRGARPATYAYVAAMLGFMSAFNLSAIDDDYDFWREHSIDALAIDVATFLETRPEDRVFTWNDDLSRYLSFHTGLDQTSYYERRSGKGYTLNRFDAEGRTQVTPGSLVIISPGQDHWSKPTAHAAHWQQVWSDGAGTTIWAVPESLLPAATTPVDVRLDERMTISAAGTSPAPAFPQQHVVLTLEFTSSEASASEVALGLDCGAFPVELRRLAVQPGRATAAVDFPVAAPPAPGKRDCTIAARTSGDWMPITTIGVGFVAVLEPETKYSHDEDKERADGSGWYRYDQPVFEGGGSVVAIEPLKPLVLAFPPVEAGAYWVDVGVYDYGDGGTNAVSVSLNGSAASIDWGAASTSGVVHRVVYLAGVPAGGSITLTIDRMGQDGVTIDSVTISDLPPPG